MCTYQRVVVKIYCIVRTAAWAPSAISGLNRLLLSSYEDYWYEKKCRLLLVSYILLYYYFYTYRSVTAGYY